MQMFVVSRVKQRDMLPSSAVRLEVREGWKVETSNAQLTSTALNLREKPFIWAPAGLLFQFIISLVSLSFLTAVVIRQNFFCFAVWCDKIFC